MILRLNDKVPKLCVNLIYMLYVVVVVSGCFVLVGSNERKIRDDEIRPPRFFDCTHTIDTIFRKAIYVLINID